MQVAMKILDNLNLSHNQVRPSVSLVPALGLCAVWTRPCRDADAALPRIQRAIWPRGLTRGFLCAVGCWQTWQRLMRGECMPLLQAVVSTNGPDCIWFPPHPSPEDQVAMRRIKVQAEKLAKSLLLFPIAVCMGQHPRLGRASSLMQLDDALLWMIVVTALYE